MCGVSKRLNAGEICSQNAQFFLFSYIMSFYLYILLEQLFLLCDNDWDEIREHVGIFVQQISVSSTYFISPSYSCKTNSWYGILQLEHCLVVLIVWYGQLE